jgi:acetoin utilization deacetylase AcuC-like enzyme
MSTAIFSHPDCLRHEMGDWHPESPARLQAIDDQLILARLDGLIEQREAPLADLKDIERNHSRAAIARLRDHTPAPGAYYVLDGDTSINAYSYTAALRAAGAAVAATDAVIAGEISNAFCSVRPPGHHARPGEAMGFCLFNNVAVAARRAMDVHKLKRVAIVDFDVHHGNGTAEAFARDKRVLMVSFFQHPLYPYSEPGPVTPRSVNIALPAHAGGEAVRDVVREYWLPALNAHKPEMIFISAGFDAHREDDLGGMALVESDYAWITQQIMDVAQRHARGRIVSCLEGGYNLSALGRSVAAHIRVLAELD